LWYKRVKKKSWSKKPLELFELSKEQKTVKKKGKELQEIQKKMAKKFKSKIDQNRIKAQILKQRSKVKHILNLKGKEKEISEEYIKTGIPGFDELFEKGIPKGTSILVAGGPGSGKTIFCLQCLNYAASEGEKVLYISLEESENKLKEHMHNFGFKSDELGNLRIKRVDPFNISRTVEALLAKAKGELKMKIEDVSELIPKDFIPNRIFIDSLTALESAFKTGEDSYRIYVEQLFRYFEKLGVTSFLITETESMPIKYSQSGVEEFLADCVIVLYNIRKGDIRESAIEVLKLRGGKHQKKIIAMQITDKGMFVYPEQEVFGEL
jgi:KaiC/GvpD/RAD55 family RecA-like ATPase